MVASLNVGCRVEGSHGDFLPAPCNPDGSQASRRKRARLQGTIVEAKGEKRWLVKFDNGLEKECPSVTLKMLGDPRYNRASAHILSTSVTAVSVAPIASNSSASDPIASVSVASAAIVSTSIPSAPIAVPSVGADNHPKASADVSDPVTDASAPIASDSAAIASTSIRSTPIEVTSVGADNHPRASADVSDPVTDASAPIASDSAASAPTEIAPVEDEDVDLLEADDEIQNEDDDGDIMDVVEKVTLDVYQQQRQQCEANKLEIIESNWSVTTKSSNAELVWNVIPDCIPEDPTEEYSSIGVRDVEWDKFKRLSSTIKSSKKNGETLQPYLELFLMLWPGDWKKQLIQLNDEILKDYKNRSKNKAGARPIRPVSQKEFFIFIGIIVFAGAAGKGGKNLFEGEKDRQKEGVNLMSLRIDVSLHMPIRRFEDIKLFFCMPLPTLRRETQRFPIMTHGTCCLSSLTSLIKIEGERLQPLSSSF
jgi:hypothetical protein